MRKREKPEAAEISALYIIQHLHDLPCLLCLLWLSRFAEQRSSLLRPHRINSAHSEKSFGLFLLSFLRAAAQLLFSPVLPRHPIILVVCDVH